MAIQYSSTGRSCSSIVKTDSAIQTFNESYRDKIHCQVQAGKCNLSFIAPQILSLHVW